MHVIKQVISSVAPTMYCFVQSTVFVACQCHISHHTFYSFSITEATSDVSFSIIVPSNSKHVLLFTVYLWQLVKETSLVIYSVNNHAWLLSAMNYRYPRKLSVLVFATWCWSCRHQAKLQHNLMYLAAIADSQPPQTAPLSQVLLMLLVVLALATLTPNHFH